MKNKSYQIKIFSLNNKNYCFSVNKFNSLEHHMLISGCNSMYKYAWDAYKQAKEIIKTKTIHVDAITKSAFEQYFDEGITDKGTTVTETSSDDMLSEHYSNIYKTIHERANGIDKDEHYEDNRKVIYYEIKSVVGEILKVLNEIEEDDDKEILKDLIKKFSVITKKHFKDLLIKDDKEEKEKNIVNDVANDEQEKLQQELDTPEEGQAIERSMASLQEPQVAPPNKEQVASNSFNHFNKYAKISNENLTDSEKEEIVNNYCDCICNTLKKRHNGIIGVKNNNKIIFSDNSKQLLSIGMNDNAEVISIRGLDEIDKMHPYHSLSFYQLYFKPILVAINHFVYVKNNNIKFSVLGCRLPDVKTVSGTHDVKLWDIKNKAEKIASISFNIEDKTWKLNIKESIKKEANSFKPSKYTEQDYYQNGKPALVMCIDPNLKSIYKKTGTVKQVIPIQNHIELDVDFGHKIIRLREEKIEIINF